MIFNCLYQTFKPKAFAIKHQWKNLYFESHKPVDTFCFLDLDLNTIKRLWNKEKICFTGIPDPDLCLMSTENFTKEYVSCKMKYEDGCRFTGFLGFFLALISK